MLEVKQVAEFMHEGTRIVAAGSHRKSTVLVDANVPEVAVVTVAVGVGTGDAVAVIVDAVAWVLVHGAIAVVVDTVGRRRRPAPDVARAVAVEVA